MADKFVWSGATGLNDGSSWADAYTSLGRDWGAEAGFTPATDFVYVRDVHAENTAAADVTITGTTPESTEEPVRILCVVGAATGTSPGNLSTGASVTTTGAGNDPIMNEGLYIYGVDFFSGTSIRIGTTTQDHDITLEQCRLELTATTGTSSIFFGSTGTVGQEFRLLDVIMDFGATGQGVDLGRGFLYWIGGSLAFNVSELLKDRTGDPIFFVGENLDLSILTNTIVQGTPNTSDLILFRRCLLGTGVTTFSGTMDIAGDRIEFIHCQIGTDADPAYQMERNTFRGTVRTDTARYRTGGASDGERTNPISWDMDTTVGSKRQYPGHPLESPPIVGWTDGDGATSHTYRIYFASGATQQDDDIWADFILPNDGATNSLGIRKTTRVAPRGTPANYTTDGTSTWTGTDVGTKQYLEVTHTPDKPGPISAVVKMVTDAGATGHIFIDPQIVVDP